MFSRQVEYQKRQIINQFSNLSGKKKELKLQYGEKRMASVLFIDIAGFNDVSDKLDYDQSNVLQNIFIQSLSLCIEKYGG